MRAAGSSHPSQASRRCRCCAPTWCRRALVRRRRAMSDDARYVAVVASRSCVRVGGARAHETYAVVIAENRSLDPGVKPLQFADDDGAKTWELFSLFADRTALFVVLDADTARLHPDAAAQRRSRPSAPPSSTSWRASTPRWRATSSAATSPSSSSSTPATATSTATARATSTCATASSRAPSSTATSSRRPRRKFVHVIVDACKSYFLVNARGGKKRWVDDRADRARAPPPTRTCRRSSRRSSSSAIRAPASSSPPRAIKRRTSGRATAAASSRTSCARRCPAPPTSTATGASSTRSCARSSPRPTRACATPRRASRCSRARPALDRHRALVDLRHASAAAARYLHFGARPRRPLLRRGRSRRALRRPATRKRAPPSTSWSRRATATTCRSRRARGRGPRIGAPAPRGLGAAVAARAPSPRAARSTPPSATICTGCPSAAASTTASSPPRATSPVEDGAPLRRSSTRRAPTLRRTIASRSATLLAGAPAGDAGISHGVDLRYAYRFGACSTSASPRSVGYGSGAGGAVAVARRALMGTLGAEWRPVARLGLRLDTALGWQLLSGTVQLGGQQLTGTEPRGLRYELAGGVNVNVAGSFGLFARGGLAVDGVYPQGTRRRRLAARTDSSMLGRAVLTLNRKTAHSPLTVCAPPRCVDEVRCERCVGSHEGQEERR